MDPIGSNSEKETILCVETEKISIRLIGERVKNNANSQKYSSSIEMKCEDVFNNIEILNTKKTCNHKKFKKNVKPLFQEQKDYQLIVEYNSGLQVEFVHESENLSNRVTEKGRKEKFLEGTLNFQSEIGYSELIFKVNGLHYLSIIIEVFPSKLDYKADYNLMMREIEEEANRLLFEHQGKTYQQMDIKQEYSNSPMEFFQILQVIFQKFMEAIQVILQNTHNNLNIKHQVLPEHKAKRTDASTRKWVLSHQQYIKKNEQGELHFDKIRGVVKEITFDTNENRFVKYMIRTTLSRLEFFNECSKKYRSDAELSKIAEMKISLNNILNATFLKSVGDELKEESMSLVFSMASGYKELYQYYHMLSCQLVTCGVFSKMTYKDTATLYEYWCFLKLNRILKDNFKERKSTLIKVKSDGLILQLKKGKESFVEYEDIDTGKRIRLIYNRTFTKLPTGAERPDFLLTVIDKKHKEEWNYIYDAKYRLDVKNEGPKREDIEVMHRYRDAIVQKNMDNDGYSRLITGCYVLFPYWNEEKYRNHQYYHSIRLIDIGGLPFLPSVTLDVEKAIKRNVRRNKINGQEYIYFKDEEGKEEIAVTINEYSTKRMESNTFTKGLL